LLRLIMNLGVVIFNIRTLWTPLLLVEFLMGLPSNFAAILQG